MEKSSPTDFDGKKIILFVVITFSISWAIWLPNVLSHHFKTGWEHSDWLHVFGGLGPMLGAIITTIIFDGLQGLKKYFTSSYFDLPRIKWLLTGFGMPTVFFVIAYLFNGLASGRWTNIEMLGLNSKIPFSNPMVIWLVWIFFYGFGEESGWRGFLFPELCKKFNPRLSVLFVALIWAPWHLPIFFYDKDFMRMGIGGTIGWVAGLIFGSLLLGWLVKQSKFSLWPVVLWHGTFNFFTTSEKIDPVFPAIMSMLTIVVALWVGWAYGKNLERNGPVNTAQ